MGRPPSPFGYALSRLGQTLARIKIWGGRTPPPPKSSIPRKMHLGGSMLESETFVVCGPKFTGLLSSNAGGIAVAVDHVSFRFWISGVIPEIFATKVESCKKSLWIWDVFFAVPNCRRPAFQQLYICYDPCLTARRMENVLWGYSH